MPFSTRLTALSLVFAALSLSPLSAEAALGEIFTVQETTSTTVVRHVGTRYQWQETRHADGSVLREYASHDGKVFAIHWTGASAPSLNQALGQHYSSAMQSLKSHPHDHHHWHVVTDTLVVHAHSYLRSYFGEAYLPQQIPAGMTAQDLY